MNRRDLIHGQATEVSPQLALGALNNRWALAQAGDFGSDLDVLNYALTLEYLESAFYVQGNKAVSLSGAEADYLKKIQSDEESHVTTLTSTIKKLGGTPVEAPMVNFGAAFENRMSFLKTSHTFENVGVGAYLGAAGFIKDKTILQAAAGIFGVEARHAAVVGNLLGLPAKGGVFMGNTETPKDKATVLAAVAPFLVATPTVPAGAPDMGAGGTSDGTTGTVLTATGAVLVAGAAATAVVAGRHRRADSGEGPDA
ncbi:ferritin-like domain-containing protein [Amycolatopsis sp., V23-08]|uniref:Ferritin-like domain-containing protein n=1 Tax=Amycolatopsis heterodermiae TaxID=3110235 RepID=A0ABU5RCA5_9PSEU|nr:ferritin-like domain-containing protein [Amycolatopsis sp., V23-08]MEA5363883.1 ferritin-like domain-containing protein [Amycolatopsis sp., V23-08]